MFKTTFGSRGGTARAALLIALTLSLLLTLLTGCTGDAKTDKTETRPSDTAPVTDTELPPATTAAPAPVTTEPAPTEPAPAETLPADWVPSLNRSDISFFGAGETFVLTVPHAPASLEILWSAEDEAIAAVDANGRVRAVGPGSARVYAEVAGTKLSCWVRCQFEAQPAEGDPTLNNTDISFFGVGESYRLTVNNAPADAQILWTSEDYGVASVDETGRVRAVGPGTIRVKAQVGETVLSCWVRCQFASQDLPRCSVADGSWRVVLRKSLITVLNEEAGVYVAAAELRSPVRLSGEFMESLGQWSRLDLSAFGLGVWRVSSIEFSEDGTSCTVLDLDKILRFSRDEEGWWVLLDVDGEPTYYSAGTARFVFTAETLVLDQMTGVLQGDPAGAIRRATVLDLFDQQPGFENELPLVGLTVSDGFVTEAVWYYHP